MRKPRPFRASCQRFPGGAGLATGTGAQPGGIGDIADATGLDVGEQGFGPGAVEPPLLFDMAEQVLTAGRDDRRKLLPDRLELGDEIVEPRQLAAEAAFDNGGIGEMEE